MRDLFSHHVTSFPRCENSWEVFHESLTTLTEHSSPFPHGISLHESWRKDDRVPFPGLPGTFFLKKERFCRVHSGLCLIFSRVYEGGKREILATRKCFLRSKNYHKPDLFQLTLGSCCHKGYIIKINKVILNC